MLTFSSKVIVELIMISNLQEIQIKEVHGRAVMAAFILNALTGWVIVLSYSLLFFCYLHLPVCQSFSSWLFFSFSLTVFLFVSMCQHHYHIIKTLEWFLNYNHECYPWHSNPKLWVFRKYLYLSLCSLQSLQKSEWNLKNILMFVQPFRVSPLWDFDINCLYT